MDLTAPHLTHPLPSLIPLGAGVSKPMGALAGAGFVGGDLLRRAAGTSKDTLPRPRRLSAAETRRLAPPLRTDGLRGGLLGWDGQTRGRRPAGHHDRPHRRRARRRRAHPGPGGLGVGDPGAACATSLTGAPLTVTARTVVNAAGVWAGDLVEDVRLRPSRGTHLVLRGEALPGLTVAVFAPIPGETNRFVLVLPQPDGRSTSASPTSPSRARSPTSPRRPRSRSASCSTSCRPPSPGRCVAPTWSAPSPGCARCWTAERAPRPTSPASTPCSRRRPASSPSSAAKLDDLPPDGRGRRGRRRRPRPTSRRAVRHRDPPAGRRRAARGTRRAGRPGRLPRPGPPRPEVRRRRRPRAERRRRGVRLGRDRSARADPPGAWRRSGRSSSSGSPTRAPRTWRTCSTAVPGSGWCPRTGCSPYRRRSVHWRSCARTDEFSPRPPSTGSGRLARPQGQGWESR
ncbi:FAD-dependent oxidoreductase [Nocardioides sp. W3-2-3]|nr:FAD-dependent oxidoreductase [Nocardioides convexus]